MGIVIKDKVNDFGTKEEYWKIANINLNAQYKFTDIKINTYSTKEDRDNDKEPTGFFYVRANWSDEEYMKYFSPESFGNANPIAAMKAYDLTTQEEIEEAMFKEYNIFERAYEYVKMKEANNIKGFYND